MTSIDHLDRPLPPHARLALLAEVLACYAWVRLLWRRRPLPALLTRLREPRITRSPPGHPAAAYRLAHAVERVTARLPDDSRCLVSSLVLVGLLGRRSLRASLVIGVRTSDGFGAHAWVELEGAPLLDPAASRFERLTEL